MSIEKDFSDNNTTQDIRNHPNDSVPTTVAMGNEAPASVASSETEKNDYTSDEKVTTKGDQVTDHEHHLEGDDPEFGVDKPTVDLHDDEADGGYGWLVILGTFCIQVTAFGVASCW